MFDDIYFYWNVCSAWNFYWSPVIKNRSVWWLLLNRNILLLTPDDGNGQFPECSVRRNSGQWALLKIMIMFICKSYFSKAMFQEHLETYCSEFYSCCEIFSLGGTIFFIFFRL